MRWRRSGRSRRTSGLGSRRSELKSTRGYGSELCAPLTRRKIAAAQAGEQAHNWQGSNVGYSGVHKRARAALPLTCSLADDTCCGKFEVALRKDAMGPLRSDKRGVYSPNLEDYWRLCRSHHNRYDEKEPPLETRFSRGKRAVARA